MTVRLVVDTNVVVSAILSPDGACREVLRRCLTRECQPVIGPALYLEYEDVMAREALFETAPIGPDMRQDLVDALMSVSAWTPISYLWRPNLPDEADNHLFELAVAGNAGWIVSGNDKHLTRGELRFDGIDVVTPAAFLKLGA
ncbi:MAG: putative toxin-antitoxin system toxin component, PIN family [Pseudomonadota bacterium]